MNFLDFVGYARKFFVALAAALAVVATALSDGSIYASEWVSITITFLGALGVYTVANVPPTDNDNNAGNPGSERILK